MSHVTKKYDRTREKVLIERSELYSMLLLMRKIQTFLDNSHEGRALDRKVDACVTEMKPHVTKRLPLVAISINGDKLSYTIQENDGINHVDLLDVSIHALHQAILKIEEEKYSIFKNKRKQDDKAR